MRVTPTSPVSGSDRGSMDVRCGIAKCPCYRTCDLRDGPERCATWRVNRRDRVRADSKRACDAAKRARRLDARDPLLEAEYVSRVMDNASTMPPFLRAAYIRSRVASAWFWKRLERDG